MPTARKPSAPGVGRPAGPVARPKTKPASVKAALGAGPKTASRKAAGKRSLLEAARVIRSKNSGPFELTLDIIFNDRATFELFRKKRTITEDRIATLYGVERGDVLGLVYFEPAQALKVTIRRIVPSGGPGDTDIYGAQQHAPLLSITF